MSNSINIIQEELSSITPFVIIDVRQDEEVKKQPILGECKHIMMDKLLSSSNLIVMRLELKYVSHSLPFRRSSRCAICSRANMSLVWSFIFIG